MFLQEQSVGPSKCFSRPHDPGPSPATQGCTPSPHPGASAGPEPGASAGPEPGASRGPGRAAGGGGALCTARDTNTGIRR